MTQTALPLHVAGWTTVDLDEANRLLTAWEHDLGPVKRPFGSQAWIFDVAGRPISVAVSCSIVSPTVDRYQRQDVVELARLCSAPGARWANRVALRLWREVSAPRWPDWSPSAAVSYSKNDRHDGRLYRFDGWEKVTDRAGKGAGKTSTWSKQRAAGHPAEGWKTLWIWRHLARMDDAEVIAP